MSRFNILSKKGERIMTDKEIVEKIYSKELIENLERQEREGTLSGGDFYEELQHAHGFRSFLLFKDGFLILDERYEKRIRWDGSLVIIISHEETKKLEKYVCNDKTGIVYVPAWNGEQRFRDCDDYFKKEED